MLANIGLAVIVIAWFMQAKSMGKGKAMLSRNFVLLYCIGVTALVLDGISNGLTAMMLLNLLAGIGAFWVYMRMK